MKIKNLISIAALSLCFASTVWAKGNQRCGIGSMIFGKSEKVLSQTLEMTTNVTSEAQSISYGTSGCKHDNSLFHKSFVMNERELKYIDANYEELLAEMAKGEGEVLAAFAQTLGCTGSVHSDFFHLTKSHYSEIITDDNSSVSLLINVKTKISQDAKLNSSCQAFVI